MAAIRQAVVTWNGDLASGQGLVSASSSKAFTSLPVSWAARTQSTEGRTSPEELVAAAHASCFSMALSAGLGRAGTPPQKLEVEATITFDQAGGSWTVVSSALKVKGRVSGIDEAGFSQAADGAKDNCPISRALKGNVALSVEATLEK